MANQDGADYGRAPLVTGDAVVLDLRPAGFVTRLLAMGMDVAFVQVPLMVLAVLGVTRIAEGLDPAATAAVQLGLTILIAVGYPTAVESLTRGRSLGKLVLGMRVVGIDGSPERFRQALARALCGAVEFWVTFGSVALYTSLVNPQGRRVGDFLAGTFVVSERGGNRNSGIVQMPRHMAEWARTAELSALSADTANTARQYVLRFHELGDQARTEMGARIAAMVAQQVAPPPPPQASPVEFLAAVLAERRRREEERLAARRPGGPA
ncbi:putative RDD family membrane protein YckC [Murinocardiopsis flavida]|uniref:Putative RDD family membrane protein YckC n=1 Tax=Murinocardiopsis flavida TaxID=645275 RepID=A0A2P8DIQ3_9ACTN|nr:RDD family protein [Murinocardiopsis flavida]PSK97107.1 putative RDD family membrane protein YckC [Murinocardiopsis flavida]